MIMSDQDSDLFQQCLHIFDYDRPHYHPGYYPDTIQQDSDDIYDDDYFRNHNDTECSHVENDEIIARTLQEEFSQLQFAEASEYSHEGEENLNTSVHSHEWHDLSTCNYQLGYDCSHDESEDMVPSRSSSSHDDGEEGSYPLELTDEYVLDDGEVGKRLNQMVPIPHIPRINGEIPSNDEAISDHERLLNRLQLYGFVELKVQGDGNCQFRALSDQLYNTPEHHKYVRRQIVHQLKSHPEIYEGYVPMVYGDYLKKMSRNGEWGDHVTLQAAADLYAVKICVITSFKDTCYIEILPNLQKSKGAIFLSFWAEVHYNSIYYQGDIQSRQIRRKKKWWKFGN